MPLRGRNYLKVNILGTEYVITNYNYKDLTIFEKKGINGYCDSTTKDIAICNMTTYPGFEDETEDYCNLVEKETLRHEVVHAFLNESGLRDSSVQPVEGWAKNEEMVDWIAIQFPKILRVFNEIKCL